MILRSQITDHDFNLGVTSDLVPSTRSRPCRSGRAMGRLTSALTCLVVLFSFLYYLSQDTHLQKLLIESNEYMEGAFFNIFTVPVSILDLCGSIISCIGYRTSITGIGRPVSWIESLVACTLLQFGGTSLTGVLLGQTPSWILSHSAFPGKQSNYRVHRYPTVLFPCSLVAQLVDDVLPSL